MSIEVFPISLSIDRCYLIRDTDGGGAILVDAGIPGQGQAFARKLRNTPVAPADIKLIVLTHGHLDHAGSSVGIAALTGAAVAAHRADVDIATGSRVSLPTPRNAYASVMRSLVLVPSMPFFARQSPGRVDVIVEDDGLGLAEFGVGGRVVHTPGHTAGSLSVVLDNGDGFLGCMAHSGPPFRVRPDLPVYADDMAALLQSWDKVLAMGVKRVFPGHGRPFAVEEIMGPLAATRRRSWAG